MKEPRKLKIYAFENEGIFTVKKIFKNKWGEISYKGYFEGNKREYQFILNPKDKQTLNKE